MSEELTGEVVKLQEQLEDAEAEVGTLKVMLK